MPHEKFIPPALLVMLVFILPAVNAQAQTAPAVSSISGSDKYAAQPFVIQKMICRVAFENDGTSVREDTSQIRIQSAAGVDDWGLVTFGYNSANQEAIVRYVKVIKPDGTIVSTPLTAEQDVTDEVSRDAPVYSDYHEKHVPVTGLSPGDVLEFQYVIRTKTPLIPGEFWYQYDFNTDSTVLDQELVVSVPKDRAVIVKSRAVQPAIAIEGSRKIYSWKTSNLKTLADDDFPLQVPPPAVQITSFKSWQEVGQWWDKLEQTQMALTPPIRDRAATLTQDMTSDAQKLKAIYEYVALQFRYISISFGIGRFKPHSAAQVLNNRYGDCKDKHTLFASLLRAAGIQAYPALMNAAREIDPDVPSPAQFDHVVSVIPLGGLLIWADTTTEVAPLGYLAQSLRGKQALLVSPSAPASIVRTPMAPPFKSFQAVDLNGTLKPDGTIVCKVHREVRGDSEIYLRQDFRETPKPDWKNVAQFVAYGSSYGGDVSDVTATSPEETDTPFSYSYKFTGKDAADWTYKRLLLQVPVLGLPVLEENAKPRKNPIQLGSPREITVTMKIQLPPGYSPKLLPPQHLSFSFADYRSTYDFKDGVLTIHRELAVKAKQIAAVELAQYNTFRKAISMDALGYTYLYTSAESQAMLPPNPESIQIFEQARDAIQTGDFETARDLLQRALNVDPQYEAGWLALGSLQLRLNEMTEAIADFRKATELNPSNLTSWKALAECLSLSRSAEAAEAWREVLKLQPNDREAHLTLGALLLNEKRFSEASSELEAAVRVGPASAPLQEELAGAYWGAGNSTAAATSLERAAQIDATPSSLNKVAASLAEHHVDLSAAQGFAEKAVHSAEGEAAQISLENLKPSDPGCMRNLAAFWRTLGWIYFQEQELHKAEAYLSASWNLQQDGLTAYHLGQVYEKEGRRQSAITVYASAMVEGVAGDPDKARSRLSQVVKSGAIVGQAVKQAREQLNNLNRVKLGRLSSKPENAEFWLLLADGGKVEGVKFIEGSANLQSAAKRLRTLRFQSPLPDNAPVKILRRGVLVCVGEGFGCDFTLLAPGTVKWPENTVRVKVIPRPSMK
ncbi:MAG TPA: DUF3857 domain-containing protein [Terriglobia bacterium]|nr:DUF3857 domain-containing protein [Terriglobia bacterium]